MAIYKINGETFAILNKDYSSIPETDFTGDYEFTGWNTDTGTETSEGVTEYNATYVCKQNYVVVWNTDDGSKRVVYNPGQIIDEPNVGFDSVGNAFRRWNGEIPVTMPDHSIEFTAVYGDHEHNYDAEIVTPVTCLADGTVRYTCSICGHTYTETVVCPGEHKWVAVAGSAGEETGYEEFECETCGEHCQRTLEYTLTDTHENSNGSYSSFTAELNYVDANGNNTQPDGNVNIVVPVSDYFGDAENVDVYRVDEDGNRTQCESEYHFGVISFITGHFSTYEFVATYACSVTGNHIDENVDGSCDSCGEPMTYIKDIIVDGDKIGEVTFTYGDTELTDLPDVPEKTGYTGEWEYTITGSELEIHPKYTAIVYYATFIADGNQVGDKVPFTVESTSITAPAVPSKAGYTGSWNTYTLSAKDITVTAEYSLITYYATFIADGRQIAKLPFTVDNMSVAAPAVPQKDGYTGKWSAYTLTASDITIEAVYTEIPNPIANAKIKIPANTEVEYAATVTVKAKATGVPEGYYVALYDGKTLLEKGSNTEVSYTFSDEYRETKTLTVKIIDDDENVQKDGSGKDLTADFEVKAKSGFFAKLIAFFKRLFKALPAVTVEPK
jgi:hypothetical protein